jgi:hypothetical protein
MCAHVCECKNEDKNLRGNENGQKVKLSKKQMKRRVNQGKKGRSE